MFHFIVPCMQSIVVNREIICSSSYLNEMYARIQPCFFQQSLQYLNFYLQTWSMFYFFRNHSARVDCEEMYSQIHSRDNWLIFWYKIDRVIGNKMYLGAGSAHGWKKARSPICSTNTVRDIVFFVLPGGRFFCAKQWGTLNNLIMFNWYRNSL